MATVNFRQKHLRAWLVTLAILLFLSSTAPAQTLDNFNRERGRIMLENIKNQIKKNYYDPTFHGMDLEARFKAAEEKIKQATSLGQVFGIIAQALLDLNDSHTFFVPPTRTARAEYGWNMQMIGDKCYVLAVKPGSDAEAKGLKVGDMILSVSGYAPTRENKWKMDYLFNVLRPQPGLKVEAQSPDGRLRQLDILAKVTQDKSVVELSGRLGGVDLWKLIRESENEDYLNRQRYIEAGDVFIWKMPGFNLTEDGVDDMMNKVNKHKALILDLRGNPGGYVITLQRLLGYFADSDIKIGDEKRRKETKSMMAKTRNRSFKGKLIVLVDNQSASSSEVFARVVQLEKLGTVIGDRTPGAVMEALYHGLQLGVETVVYYGANITIADLIMTDGKSLEGVGVTPDEIVLPTASDLAARLDPVLSRAAAIVGLKIEPKEAGTMFPIEWRK